MHFNKLTILFALVLAALLSGCAGTPTVKMNAADRATINSVSMTTPPTLPADMFYHGRAQSFAMLGGLIGAALAEGAAREPRAQLLETMKSNEIDLPSILATEFFSAASSRGLFRQAESPALAEGDLALSINVYGFGQTQGLSALLYPLLNVTATIKKPDGEIAWQKTDFAVPLNSENRYGYRLEQYLSEPDLLRKTLTNISGIVSRMLLDDFARGH